MTRPYLDVPFTNDAKQMEQGLARIDSRGGTAMRDAINMSIDYLKSNGKKDKKVLIIVTDGNDNASGTSLERVVQRVDSKRGSGIRRGAAGEEQRHEAAKAKRALKELTTATGGVVFYPKDLSEIGGLVLEIAERSRSQYTLAYTPQIPMTAAIARSRWTVDAPGRPVVRTRSGYYARAVSPPASTSSSSGAVE